VPRTLLFCTALALFPSSAWAEATITPTETVIRLNVQPMAAPKPALRYLLLPELHEMNPGNPIAGYLQCLLDQDFTSDRGDLRKSALRGADQAARLDKPDWQILLKLKTDGFGLLLPDLQKMRQLAASLQIRFRDEIAQGRFDDAIRTAKTMFALSRHMGEHPTLIGDLVAIAIASVTIAPLEEMLEQPGCPNLYWALTNLPDPFISMNRGMEGERMLVRSELHDLDDRSPMSADQLKKLITHIGRLLDEGPDQKKTDKTVREWLNARTKDEASVRAARRRLIEVGSSEDRLLRFPAEQVILLDERREYESRRDEFMKLMNLPSWQLEALASQIKQAKEPALFAGLVPSLHKVRRAQGRLEQRIALLRHVEALRIYAASHGGKLPQQLADSDVPLPNDPFTGKPFRYTLDGTTAHLRGSPPAAEAKNAGYNLHYEVTIQK
jgi:hypothetical protein